MKETDKVKNEKLWELYKVNINSGNFPHMTNEQIAERAMSLAIAQLRHWLKTEVKL